MTQRRALDTTRGCFGCGRENAAGLGLKPETDGVSVFARLVVAPAHRGFRGIAHGGILMTALDEMLAYAIGSRLVAPMVTLAVDVTFHAPVRVGDEVDVIAWPTGRRGKHHFGRAEVRAKDGTVHAAARGRFVVLPEKARARFVEGA